MALVNAAMVVIPDYRYLFPLRVASALSSAAYNTTSLALMGDLLERRRGRGRTMGIYRGLGSLSFAVMAFFSGSIADRTSLRVPFGVEAGFLALACLLAFLVRDVPFGAHDRRREAKTAAEAADPSPAVRADLSLTPLLVSGVILSLAMSASQSVWANYLVNDLGFTNTDVTRLWSLTALSEFPFLVLTGWLSDRMGRLPVLTLGLLGWAVVLLGYALVPFYPWIQVMQLVRGFAFGAFTATAMVYVTEVSTQAERGRASGVYSAFRGVGSIVGGTVGGLLAQLLGYVSLLFMCSGLLTVGGGYLAVVTVRARRAVRGLVRRDEALEAGPSR
jgi:MFS family permease